MLDFEEDGAGSGGYAKTMSKEFIEAEMKLFAEQAKGRCHYYVVQERITCPYHKEMVKSMKQGSVIVGWQQKEAGIVSLLRRVKRSPLTVLRFWVTRIYLPGWQYNQADSMKQFGQTG